jgi:hypothetical protein
MTVARTSSSGILSESERMSSRNLMYFRCTAESELAAVALAMCIVNIREIHRSTR